MGKLKIQFTVKVEHIEELTTEEVRAYLEAKNNREEIVLTQAIKVAMADLMGLKEDSIQIVDVEDTLLKDEGEGKEE